MKLAKISAEIVVIEPDISKHVEKIVGIDDIEITFLTELNRLNSYKRVPNFDLCTIANWGPEHFETLKWVREQSINKVLIEKPLASKLNHLNVFERSLHKKGTFVNFHLRFDSSLNTLRNILLTEEFGQLTHASVIAGAKCISTNGIHWLDWLLSFVKASPTHISSDCRNTFINPRANHLSYIEGNLNIFFANSVCISMNFSNASYFGTKVILLFESALCEIENGKISIKATPISNLKDSPVYRSMSSYEFEESSMLANDGIDTIYNTMVRDIEYVFKSPTLANRLIILGLVSSELNRSIGFAEQLPETLLCKEWNIS